MTQPTPAPATPAADARRRALRTFAQGLIFDVLTTAVLVLSTQVGDVRWTKAYGLTVAGLVGKSVATAALSYVMRFVKPPASA